MDFLVLVPITGVLTCQLSGEVRTKKLALTQPEDQRPGWRVACKDRIAQRSPIQAAATFNVACSGYLALTVVPAALRH
ncbi:hypothetical protein J6590_028519 [Homalodisca vitripennis]|nr:hypothetical protein J6590_028519 [Homalodisca vitripennis]